MAEDQAPRLGFIGLGNLGAPMANRLIDWPGGLIVFDVRPDAATPFAEAGVRVADAVGDVAAADIISVMVLDDEQVRDVVAELAAHAKPGTVIAIHSTIDHNTAAELAGQLKAKDIHVIDAPVSGGVEAVKTGQLAVMVGADREVYERVKPAFKQWASMVVHAGEPGAGTRMKLARNMLTFTSFAARLRSNEARRAGGFGCSSIQPGGAPHRCTKWWHWRDDVPRGHEPPARPGSLPI
jgi:3-hydroxyisobutyrate dehydrogenase-like beta-hydroxyacid dehydrogenase